MATSLKLATTSFQTKPDEALAPVDVYDKVESGVVVNSYQNKADVGGGFDLDGLIGKLSGVDVKSVLGAAKQATSFAKKAAGIYNNIKNGNFAGALGGAASLAGNAGLGELAPAIRTAQRGLASAQAFAKNPSISGALRLGGSIGAGTDASSLTRLGNLVTQAQNQSKALGMAINSGNMMGMVNAADRLTSGAMSMYSSFDKLAQVNFGEAAQRALGMSSNLVAGRESLDALLGTATALSKRDISFSNHQGDVAIEAGTVAGISWAAAQEGYPDVFSSSVDTTTEKGLEIAKASGIPLVQLAIETGDAGLYNSIMSTDKKLSAAITAAIPNAKRNMLANLKTPIELTPWESARYFDKLVAQDSDDSWKQMERDNQQVLDSFAFSSNPDVELMLEAKTNTLEPDYDSSNIDDTAFLLMGSKFKGESVDNSLKEDFPDFYDSIKEDTYSQKTTYNGDGVKVDMAGNGEDYQAKTFVWDDKAQQRMAKAEDNAKKSATEATEGANNPREVITKADRHGSTAQRMW